MLKHRVVFISNILYNVLFFFQRAVRESYIAVKSNGEEYIVDARHASAHNLTVTQLVTKEVQGVFTGTWTHEVIAGKYC